MMPAPAAQVGFDALWLEAEHNTWDRREIPRLVALHHLANIDGVVRTGSRNANELYHLLEDGVTALMIPLLNTPEDADRVIQATDCVGFVGASSLERMCVEESLTNLTRQFKSISAKRRN